MSGPHSLMKTQTFVLLRTSKVNLLRLYQYLCFFWSKCVCFKKM